MLRAPHLVDNSRTMTGHGNSIEDEVKSAAETGSCLYVRVGCGGGLTSRTGWGDAVSKV